MDDFVSTGMILLVAVAAAAQVGQATYAIWYLRRMRTQPLSHEQCPPALVLLCLRGGDSHLKTSLSRLVAQDYPDYRVRIMLDSSEDPAHDVLAEVFPDGPPEHVEIRHLTERLSTCTYKLSAILEGTLDLSDDIEFVAVIDGDAVVHPTWLQELAAPIVRRGAAVATGNRWFFPDAPSLGSMCRFWWTIAVVPTMTCLRVPWGGSMAVRTAQCTSQEFRDRISRASSEDVATGRFACDQGELIHVEPSLMILNREDIGVEDSFHFMTRQALFLKLENPTYWWGMMCLGLLPLGYGLYPVLRLLGLEASGQMDMAFAMLAGMAVAAVTALEMTLRRVLASRGERMRRWSWRHWFYAVLALYLTPVLHLAGTLRILFMRRFRWRGVWYRIDGPSSLRVDRDEWAAPASPSRRHAAPPGDDLRGLAVSPRSS